MVKYLFVYIRENRYLLFLTENYSALRILEQTDLIDHDPLILFGSSFPQDINYTQVITNMVVQGSIQQWHPGFMRLYKLS